MDAALAEVDYQTVAHEEVGTQGAVKLLAADNHQRTQGLRAVHHGKFRGEVMPSERNFSIHYEYMLRHTVHAEKIVALAATRERLLIFTASLLQKHIERCSRIHKETELLIVGGDDSHTIGTNAIIKRNLKIHQKGIKRLDPAP